MSRLDPDSLPSSDYEYASYFYDTGELARSMRYYNDLSMEDKIRFKEERSISLTRSEQEYADVQG